MILPAPLRAVSPRDGGEPVGAAEFARVMAGFAPFEPAPHLAVAVSGGSDSMALALLTQAWSRARGGRVTALTVDHGLRSEAAAEAAQTGTWCAAHGMAHATLRWEGPYPPSGIQEEARRARYRLLEEWCEKHGVLHLLVAHQCEDQAETLLMRAQRASGPDGLGGMSAVVEMRAVRILRPVLAFPRARLRANLAVAGQGWIDDPSNRNPDFLRVKLRSALQALDEHAAVIERLQGLAARFGRLRAIREAQAARLLARAAMLHPAGFAVLDPRLLVEASEETALKALAAVLTTVSGGDYPPRRERLERLFRSLPAGLARGRTLQGCVILPHRGGLLVAREPAAAAPPTFAHKNAITHWDGRFLLTVDDAVEPLWIGALGGDLRLIRRDMPAAALAAIPPAARATLPALRDAKGVVAVPALRYFAGWLQEAGTTPFRMVFRPTRPAADAGFRIV